MKVWILGLIAAAMLLPFSASAETDIVAFPAELSVSFEAVPGKLVLAGNQVLFWSESPTYPSVYFQKANVHRASISNGVLLVELNEPTQVQTGSTNRFSFRLTGTSDTAVIDRWFSQTGGAMTVAPAAAGAAAATSAAGGSASGETYTYNAEHTRRFGSNRNGKLVFTPQGVSWESLDDATQSRTWPYKSIRRFDRSNPYSLEIDTFSDGKYSFKMTTKPIGNEEFSKITDYLAAARTAARQ
ncbi:MAG: hypothetical protein IT169_10175 [Bryobacterales bacterium]|nr:hypothetical protein [Bryobacterales bacterium]